MWIDVFRFGLWIWRAWYEIREKRFKLIPRLQIWMKNIFFEKKNCSINGENRRAKKKNEEKTRLEHLKKEKSKQTFHSVEEQNERVGSRRQT